MRKQKKKDTESEKIQWHPAFCSATILDFKEDEAELEFFPEENLSKKPLVLDLKIIKKKSDSKLKNEIGHIFRRHNILEYKSPEDALNIDTFYKVIGYAGLYKSLGKTVDERPASEITISLFREKPPIKLFNTLKREGYEVKEKYQGIYYVTGKTPFAAQIVVTSQLKSKEHSLFHLLSNEINEEDIQDFLEQSNNYKKTQSDKENIESVMVVAYQANIEFFNKKMEEYNMKTFQEFVEECIGKEKLIKSKQEGFFEALAKLVKQGIISLKIAANQAGISEKDFSIKMKDLAL